MEKETAMLSYEPVVISPSRPMNKPRIELTLPLDDIAEFLAGKYPSQPASCLRAPWGDLPRVRVSFVEKEGMYHFSVFRDYLVTENPERMVRLQYWWEQAFEKGVPLIRDGKPYSLSDYPAESYSAFADVLNNPDMFLSPCIRINADVYFHNPEGFVEGEQFTFLMYEWLKCITVNRCVPTEFHRTEYQRIRTMPPSFPEMDGYRGGNKMMNLYLHRPQEAFEALGYHGIFNKPEDDLRKEWFKPDKAVRLITDEFIPAILPR